MMIILTLSGRDSPSKTGRANNRFFTAISKIHKGRGRGKNAEKRDFLTYPAPVKEIIKERKEDWIHNQAETACRGAEKKTNAGAWEKKT